MATKKASETKRTYRARKPKYVLVVVLDGRAYASVESWSDREYVEYLSTKTEGTSVMQRGGSNE